MTFPAHKPLQRKMWKGVLTSRWKHWYFHVYFNNYMVLLFITFQQKNQITTWRLCRFVTATKWCVLTLNNSYCITCYLVKRNFKSKFLFDKAIILDEKRLIIRPSACRVEITDLRRSIEAFNSDTGSFRPFIFYVCQ